MKFREQMKKLLLSFFLMATWMVVSCGTTTYTTRGGCWGYTVDERPIRGTIAGKNDKHVRPYRQCVDETFPHGNTHIENY